MSSACSDVAPGKALSGSSPLHARGGRAGQLLIPINSTCPPSGPPVIARSPLGKVMCLPGQSHPLPPRSHRVTAPGLITSEPPPPVACRRTSPPFTASSVLGAASVSATGLSAYAGALSVSVLWGVGPFLGRLVECCGTLLSAVAFPCPLGTQAAPNPPAS